ncbi:MAG: folylpolyglutamate synthase/dihydrofolate synthase family protein [Thermoanaerobaculia bacterium]
MKLGLAAIDSLCDRLGRPERRVPSVLVGGTNGKGSTAAMVSSIAREAGVRAGLYTSPHLIHVTERIRLEDADVSSEELDASLGRVFGAADRAPEIPATYFEAMTAAAFDLFARRELELAVLEVGLGGRFDATNVVPARLSAVTSISLDHVEELGGTLSAVAGEKAGIFRAGRPALAGFSHPDALHVLREAARAVGADFHDLAGECVLEMEAASLDGGRFSLRTPVREYALATPLPGRHQAANAVVAVRAVELLSPEISISAPEAIAAGLGRVRWPGRLERFRVAGRTILLDGCHNPEGAAALARFLLEAGIVAETWLVFGAMADKDVETIAGSLFPALAGVSLVAPESSRAATPEELARRVSAVRPDARPEASLEAALRRLVSSESAKTIIVAGSLYLVGEARALLLAGRLGTPS